MIQYSQLTETIIPRLLDVDKVKAMALDPLNWNPDPHFGPSWDDLSLSNGFPSILLLASELKKQGFLSNADEVIHSIVVRIKEIIEKKGIYDFSLFSGVIGICFALQNADSDAKRYDKMIQVLYGFLYDKMDQVYLSVLKQNRRQGIPSSPRLYDPIQGIAGIGRYALDHLDILQKLAEDVARALVDFIKPFNYKGQIVPGWYVSSHDPLNRRNFTLFPRGNFNLGLAHGVTGILAYLSIASLRGVSVSGQKEAIQTLVEWIRKKSYIIDRTIMWPYYVSWEEEIDYDSSLKMQSRDAWCYGVPAISRTLFLAGKALKDDELKTFSLKAFKSVFYRTREQWQLPGPAICHGISGLLLMTHEMSKEKGGEELTQKVNDLEKIVYSHFNESAYWGFHDVEHSNYKQHKINKPGFLEGSAGILLTLLCRNSSFNWHLPLMIHE